MSEANVSNMRRVLRLPEKFLKMIDKGELSFTQGRELLTLENVPAAEEIMTLALGRVKGLLGKGGTFPDTVEGLHQAINDVALGRFRYLNEETPGFDIQAAGCLKCNKCFVISTGKNTPPTRFCADDQCFNEHLEKQKTAKTTDAGPDISQEKSAEGTAGELIHALHTNDAERVAELTQPPPPAVEKKKEEEKPAARPAQKPAVIMNPKLRKIIIEEKEDGVTVSIMSAKGLSIEGLAGSLEDSLPKLSELLAKAMKGS